MDVTPDGRKSAVSSASVGWPDEGAELYRELARPGLAERLKLLGLDVCYERASGEFLYRLGHKAKVLDLVGGYGSTLLGHNHPELKRALRDFLDADGAVHAQTSLRAGAGRVAAQLGRMLRRDAAERCGAPDEAYVCHLLNSGAEAVEGALKHALMAWRDKQERVVLALRRRRAALEGRDAETDARLAGAIEEVSASTPVFIAITGGYHGKTAGALAATSNERFSSMYAARALPVTFVARDADAAAVAAATEGAFVAGVPGIRFSCLAGAIFEPIQGEGGVHPLPRALVHALREACDAHDALLIADEIQTGLYRTGTLLASTALGVVPDVALFGKVLGGGLVKCSALAVRRARYVQDFDVLHSSTYAEDDLSSAVALKALEILDRDRAGLAAQAAAFEAAIRAGVARIGARYPGVIREVRGKGLLLAVAFHEEEDAPYAMCALRETGYLGYVYAAFLLDRFDVRVAATLSDPGILRLEPCAAISEASVEQTLRALEGLAAALAEGRILELTESLQRPRTHLTAAKRAVVSPPSPIRAGGSARPPERTVHFLSHIIDETHLNRLDPLFSELTAGQRAHFLDAVAPRVEPYVYHDQVIEGLNGGVVRVRLVGMALPSAAFEASVRRGQAGAFLKTERAFELARREGAAVVGLGQYTSIVSLNGRMLAGRGPAVTTGNRFTVAMAHQGLLAALAHRGKKLADLRVAVCGAAGNIGRVLAELLLEDAGEVLLLHREALAASVKFQEAFARIAASAPDRAHRLAVAADASELAGADVIVAATNLAKPFIREEHLKPGAVVLDVSVPSAVDPAAARARPDVDVLLGGFARLPFGQKLLNKILPAPEGEVFACMAETVMLGLVGHDRDFSLGALDKAGVRASLALAERAGITLGSLKQVRN